MKRDDSLWKAILEDVFDDFLRFFIPNADDIFDFSRPFEFLDKELEQLFPSNPNDFSPKYVDKLVKVFTKEGAERWILVHVEVQGSKDTDFGLRMFQYYYRIHDKFKRPIAAFAILTDTNKRFKPSGFEQEFLGTSVRYAFNSYKVLEQNEVALSENANPFAMVILTTLAALKKGKLTEDELFSEKIDLARRLLNLDLSKDKIRVLMNFLKLYVRFGNEERSSKFDSEVDQLTNKPKSTMGIEQFVLERERRIGEEKGLEKGLEKGIEKGLEKGLEKAILNSFDNGFTLEQIRLITGESVAYISDVLKKNKRM